MASDQGTRIVTCSKHGIAYDASKRGGCSRCISEWNRQKQESTSESGIPTLVKLLALLGAVAGLYVFLSRPDEREAAAPVPAADPAVSASLAAAEESERALRQILKDISGLIRTGRTDAESQMNVTGEPDQRRLDWEYWADDWGGRVDRLRRNLPAKPDSQDDLRLALVFQEADRALNELRELAGATSDGLPDAQRVAQRFEAAEKAVQQARLHLSQAR